MLNKTLSKTALAILYLILIGGCIVACTYGAGYLVWGYMLGYLGIIGGPVLLIGIIIIWIVTFRRINRTKMKEEL